MSHNSFYSPERRTKVTTYTYDSQNRLTSIVDPMEDVDFVYFDALLRFTQRPRRQADKSADGTSAASALPDPAFSVWNFGRFPPKYDTAFEVYVEAPPGPSLSDWHNDYMIVGGTLIPAADINDTPLGDGRSGWRCSSRSVNASCGPTSLRRT